MYSSEFLKFLVGRDINEYLKKEEKTTDNNSDENVIYRYSKLATVPIEIKH